MKQFLLIIALTLAIVQGIAAEFPSGLTSFGIGELPTSQEELVESKNTSTRNGEAPTQKSDVNGDGSITIADVTDVIDFILLGLNNLNADVNGDGVVTIADLTELIDFILGEPESISCTYLIVTKTNGTTKRFMIDEYTKVKIARPLLIIWINGKPKLFFLENVAHLSYEVREPSGEQEIEEYSKTLNTIEP